MQIDTEELGKLSEMIYARQIQALQQDIADLRKQADYWQLRCKHAEELQTASQMESIYLKNYIMLSMEKIRSFVSHLTNVDRWAFLRSFMQVSLPDELMSMELPMLEEAMPLPSLEKPLVNNHFNAPVGQVVEHVDKVNINRVNHGEG